jgi:excisionase family DNA binding protein
MALDGRQAFTTVAALARYLGVSTRTVREWIRKGSLPASQVQDRLYTDDRERKTARGTWRIYGPHLEAFLARLRGGGTRARLPSWLLR